MILSKNTPAQLIEIREPIWDGRKIGIATYKIGNHNEIRILKKNINGERTYPQPFYISGERARQYPEQAVKSNPNIKLYIIPIADLQTLERV